MRAFADSREPSVDEWLAAPVRWPRPSLLAEPLSWSHGKLAEAAASIGLETVGDLLRHLPRGTGEARMIADLQPEDVATVLVEVRSITSRPVRRRGMKPLVEAVVADASGTMKATFFNQPWLQRSYCAGTRLMLQGKYQGRNRFRVGTHAITYEQAAVALSSMAGEAVAEYPATKGISSTQIMTAVREHREAARNAPELLPARLRVAERLPDVAAAFEAAHFGDHEGGRRRLAFDELLLDQLVQLRLRAERRADAAASALDEPATLTRTWREQQLPFALTGDQQRAIEQVDADLALERPMQRLLMGEVGSGKTVVALHAMLRAVEHGRQAALMAPTETLAEQHFATLQALMGGRGRVWCRRRCSPARHRRRAGADVLSKLATGELGLVVGTHALLEDPVGFADLAVAIVDEQHRFGVRQRSALDAKARPGLAPHVLHMTATPIPRTLRLASFGALDVTALHELPRGRQPIATRVVVGEAARAQAYDAIREQLRAGRQAFVVCPLVEESEALSARAATAEFERLRDGELRDFRVVLMHGQMRPREKQEAMAAFAGGVADVLVATTVIEVGIDVPNATVMLVEDADRYGISQLHQLRGRVGRGDAASQCLLLGPAESRRLRALAEHADGFRLAEIDLELRGEGELTGTRQSGLARFRFAQLPDDAPLLERAHAHAQALLAADPELAEPEHALLGAALAEQEAAPLAA